MNVFYRSNTALLVLLLSVMLAGCSASPAKPPLISLDDMPVTIKPDFSRLPLPAFDVAEPPTTIVEVPKVLPLPGQLKPLGPPGGDVDKGAPDPAARVARANQEARVVPRGDGYINAIQVWPYTEGALYQLYTSPGRVTAVALQAGETLIAVSAGDTARWLVGDTASGSGADRRVQILVKPTRAGLNTNMVITTDRRTYLLDLVATPAAWMASASWNYPLDSLRALKGARAEADAAAPIASGLSLERLQFRYAITGDSPPWRPLRAFDDGERVYIQFPSGIAQGELPPVFVVGPQGDAQLVNYRFRTPYYVIDRLFGAAELRLGGDKADIVRITRTDGQRRAGR